MRTFYNFLIGVGILLVLGLIGLVSTVDFIDNYEVGYKFDLRTGEIDIIERQGYVITPPFVVKVHTIDLRPMQVCITGGTTANTRILNCKLIQFNPGGLRVFIEWHGRGSYRNSGLNSSFNQILMSYVYEGTSTKYPFVNIVKELKTETTDDYVNDYQSVEDSQTVVPQNNN
jgi:hypothetical protein